MPASPENPDLDALLARRAFGEVLQRTQISLRRNPRDLRAWHAQARAAFALGRLTVADEAIERAMRLNAASHDIALLRAIIDHRLGRSDAAIDRLRGLIAKGAPNTVDATMALDGVSEERFPGADATFAVVITFARPLRRRISAALSSSERLVLYAQGRTPAPADRAAREFTTMRTLDSLTARSRPSIHPVAPTVRSSVAMKARERLTAGSGSLGARGALESPLSTQRDDAAATWVASTAAESMAPNTV